MMNARCMILSVAFAAAVTVLPAGRVWAQRPQEVGPPIGEIRIKVDDQIHKEDLGYVRPGNVLTLDVGDRVFLRVVAFPVDGRRAPRYPRATWEELAGKARIQMTRVNPDLGSCLVEAIRPDNPGNNGATTLVSFKILDPLNLRKGLMGGTVSIEVRAPRPRDRGPAAHPGELPRSGIVLFEHTEFRGRSQTFYSSVRNLHGSLVGNDEVSSVQVAPGCRAILYEDADFRGRAAEVRGPVSDLSFTRVGNDRLSSFRLECDGGDRAPAEGGRRPIPGDGRPNGGRGHGTRVRGVTLFEHRGFGGEAQTFTGDVRDLRGTAIGSDRASSVEIDPGCRATLYEHVGFQGRALVVTEDIEDLRATRLGNDSVSSLTVECRSFR